MPPLGSSEFDLTNINLLTEWIQKGLPARQTYDTWRQLVFGSMDSPEGQPAHDADGDGTSNREEFLTGTDPRDGSSFPSVAHGFADGQFQLNFYAPQNRSVQVETSHNLIDWSLWNVPENHGLPQPGGAVSITGPVSEPQQFFKLRFQEN